MTSAGLSVNRMKGFGAGMASAKSIFEETGDVSQITVGDITDELVSEIERRAGYTASVVWRGCKIEGAVYDITFKMERTGE